MRHTRDVLAGLGLMMGLCACNVVGPPSVDYADVEGQYLVSLTRAYFSPYGGPVEQDACSGTLTLFNQDDHEFDAMLYITETPGCGPPSTQLRGVVHPDGVIVMEGTRDYSARGCTHRNDTFEPDLFSGRFAPAEFTLRRRTHVHCAFPGLGVQDYDSEEAITAVRAWR